MDTCGNNVKSLLVSYTGGKIREALKQLEPGLAEKIIEVRLRANKPLIIKKANAEYFVCENGKSTQNPAEAFCPGMRDIGATLDMISQYSLYAFDEELKNGFITIPGGNRIGICGRAVIENGSIKTIKNISGINIRITHEIKGCADTVAEYVLSPSPRHLLVISPPGRGKTTLLRDIIRLASNSGYNIGIADERSEIAACYMGAAQNDIGIRSDVLDGCPKAEGMLLLLRSMSPYIIAVDEIGKKEDIYAIEDILNAGVKLFCTVHGVSVSDISKKPVLCNLIEKRIFERYIVLSNNGSPGTVEGVYDENMRRLL